MLRHPRGMKFLLLAAALVTTAFAGDFTGEAGLQLYSLRDSFKKDVPGSLDKVKAFGVRRSNSRAPTT